MFFGLTVLTVALVLTTINHLAAAPTAEPVPASAPELPAAGEVRATVPQPEPDTAPTLRALPALPELIAETLPVRLRQARLVAMGAEDHDLRIHTDAGSDLVLMRMTDACALLPASAGARVHRSWRAARGAVETLARREDKAELALKTGLTVPVSRAMLAGLREQGRGQPRLAHHAPVVSITGALAAPIHA